MTFPVPQRSRRLCEVVSRTGAEMIARAQARAGSDAAHRPRLASILLASLVLYAGCTPTTYSVVRDPPDYVDHVLEDVTAIVEGMASAHAKDRVVYRDPGLRSSRQPKLN